MAQTSFGWRGTVNELQWAQLGSLMGQGAGLATPADCRVTQVAGQRAVSVAAGSIFGDGVLTTLSTAETMTLPAPTNGQWFLLVLNRIWSSKATSLTLRNGPTTATATSGNVPTSYPATFANGVGSNSDVAVAWLWGNSSGTAVTIVPILRAPSSVQPRNGTTAQRDALYGTPSTSAAQAYLDGAHWTNTSTSASERYVGPIGSTSGGVATPGWYPVDGMLPLGSIKRSAASAVPGSGTKFVPDNVYTWAESTLVLQGAMACSSDRTTWTVPLDGLYEVEGQMLWTTNGAGSRSLWFVRNTPTPAAPSDGDVSARSVVWGEVKGTDTNGTIVRAKAQVYLSKGDTIVLWAAQSSGGTLSVAPGQTTQTINATYLRIAYLRPAYGRANMASMV